MQRAKTSVIIAGGGPVGLYASALLSRARVPHLLLDNQNQPSMHPRAHLINTRSVELLRHLGIQKQLEQLAPPRDQWEHFRYCTSLLGQQIAADHHMATDEWSALRALSPVALTHVSQPGLEALLRVEAERGAAAAGSSLLRAHELVGFERRADERGGGVVASVRAAGGDEFQVEASALVGCDGAHSFVRRHMGVRLDGPPPLQHFVSVHFRAPGLAPRLARQSPAMLYFVFHPRVIAVLVAHNIEKGEWVAQIPYFPPLQQADDLDTATCESLLRTCVGNDAVRLDVVSMSPWKMSAKVAQRLSSGPVFLAGDAAHQFPPAGAFGMNTGLQDAHNLCWKLAAVHHGAAAPELLRSYDAERRPVALANARLAVHNYERGLRVSEALGLPASAVNAAASFAETVLAATPAPLAALGSAAARAVGGALVESARSHLIGTLGHAASHRLGGRRLEKARAVVERGEALPLLFPRHELGFRYDGAGAAIVGAGGASGAERNVEDERLDATCEVGGRLPHLWLTLADGRRVSSLDLSCGGASESGLVAVGPEAEFQCTLFFGATNVAWSQAAQRLRLAAPLRLVSVHGGNAERAVRDAAAVAATTTTTMEGEVGGRILPVQDVEGAWTALLGVEASGAVLVRPDGHVAWRRVGGASSVEEYERALFDAMSSLHATVAPAPDVQPELECESQRVAATH